MDWNQKAEELHLVQPGDCTLVLGEFGTLSDTTIRGFKLKYWNYENSGYLRGFLAGCSSWGMTWGGQVRSSGRLYEKIGFSQLGLKPYLTPIDFYNEGLLRCFSHPTLGQLQFSAEGSIVPNATDFCERVLVSRNKRQQQAHFRLVNNPVTEDILYLESHTGTAHAKVEIYTLEGKKVYSSNYAERLEIPTPLPSGIYSLLISTSDRHESTYLRFIKM